MSEENINATPSEGGEQTTSQGVQETSGDSGASELQTQAQTEITEIKAKLVNGTATDTEKRQYKASVDFLHFGGDAPAHLNPKESIANVDPNAAHSYEAETLQKNYQPTNTPDEYKTSHLKIPESFEVGDLETLKDLAHSMQLPKEAGEFFLERYMHHANVASEEGLSNDVQQLDAEGHAEYLEKATKNAKSLENFMNTGQKAVKYLQSVMEPTEYQKFAAHYEQTTLMYDMSLLNKLAALADAKGL